MDKIGDSRLASHPADYFRHRRPAGLKVLGLGLVERGQHGGDEVLICPKTYDLTPMTQDPSLSC
jgi:hypothetical protein